MKFRRKTQVLSTLLAVMSLFVSAVSACACSHHEPVRPALETASCHGPSHAQPETSTVETSEESIGFEGDCNCFAKSPVPGIIAKTDQKRVGVESQSDAPVYIASAFVPVFSVETASQPEFDPPDHDYKTALLSALPSRAPPRL